MLIEIGVPSVSTSAWCLAVSVSTTTARYFMGGKKGRLCGRPHQCFLPWPRQAVSGASRSQSGNTRRRMSATSALARATAWDPLSPRATPRVDTPRISRVDMRRRWVFPLLRLDTPRGVRLEPEPPARALSDAAPPSPSPRRSSDVAFRASTSGSDGLGRYTCRFPVGLRWGTATRLRSR